MSFFFGKKKGQNPPADAPRSSPANRDVSGGPGVNSATVNGVKSKAPSVAGAPATQTSTTGTGVNNSITSINGAKTPSPDHGRGTEGASSAEREREKERERGGGSLDDGQVCWPLSWGRFGCDSRVESNRTVGLWCLILIWCSHTVWPCTNSFQ